MMRRAASAAGVAIALNPPARNSHGGTRPVATHTPNSTRITTAPMHTATTSRSSGHDFSHPTVPLSLDYHPNGDSGTQFSCTSNWNPAMT